MMIPIQILVVFVTCAGLVNPAATGPRQERRLEDSGHFNAGFVEYKSKGDSVVNGDDEIDEYVVIETNDREKDDNKIVDDPYEEVDNHYDDDLEDEEHPILNKSVSNHGLVPQLWDNYTGPELPPPETVSCNEARIQCAYRAGCGFALQNYILGCSDLAKGKTKTCHTHCRHSLIALMSTLEGKRLMKCNCSGDLQCEHSKSSVIPCHDAVNHATRPDTVVSCSTAQWICAADPQCATALEYFNGYCGAMFRGKKCTDRCRNSIDILRRQDAASKLETCFCDGTEDFECHAMKANMDRLCFNPDSGENEIDIDGPKKSSSLRAKLEKLLLVISFIITIFAEFVRGSLLALFHINNEPVIS